MSISISNICVIGAGAWGTALALAFTRAGKKVHLLARDPQIVHDIQNKQRNEKYLPGIELPQTISASIEIGAIDQADAIVIATPTQFVRHSFDSTRARIGKKPIVITAKGIELQTDKMVHEVAHEFFPLEQIAVLSGPSFAAEVAVGYPTALTLASVDAVLGERIASAIASPVLRPYWTSDIVGVSIGGALKNVIAIAAGIVIARGMGENSRAALITRGSREITGFAEHMGAKGKTMTGLAGMGDLMLTCYSAQSRNFRFGQLLGQSISPDAAEQKIHSTVEGRTTARAIADYAQKNNIDMPICFMVDAVISGQLSIDQAIERLMQRPLRQE